MPNYSFGACCSCGNFSALKDGRCNDCLTKPDTFIDWFEDMTGENKNDAL